MASSTADLQNIHKPNVRHATQQKSAHEIMAKNVLVLHSNTELKWLPVVDGNFITDVPTALLRGTNLDGVEVLIGVNRNEGSMFSDQLTGKKKLKSL